MQQVSKFFTFTKPKTDPLQNETKCRNVNGGKVPHFNLTCNVYFNIPLLKLYVDFDSFNL